MLSLLLLLLYVAVAAALLAVALTVLTDVAVSLGRAGHYLPLDRAGHIVAVIGRVGHIVAVIVCAGHTLAEVAVPVALLPWWLRRSHSCRGGCAGHTLVVVAVPVAHLPWWLRRSYSCRGGCAGHTLAIVAVSNSVLTTGRAAHILAVLTCCTCVRQLSDTGQCRCPHSRAHAGCSLGECPKTLTLSSSSSSCDRAGRCLASPWPRRSLRHLMTTSNVLLSSPSDWPGRLVAVWPRRACHRRLAAPVGCLPSWKLRVPCSSGHSRSKPLPQGEYTRVLTMPRRKFPRGWAPIVVGDLFIVIIIRRPRQILNLLSPPSSSSDTGCNPLSSVVASLIVDLATGHATHILAV